MKQNQYKLIFLSFGALFLTAATEVPAAQPVALIRSGHEKFHSDRVIVQMKAPSAVTIKTMGLEKAHRSALEKLAHDSNLTLKSTFTIGDENVAPFAVVTLDSNKESVDDAIKRLQSNPEVQLAQPDFIYRTSAVPNDTQYGKLWGLKNTAQTLTREHYSQSLYSTANPGTVGKDIGAEAAWDKITDCSNVVVAVIDTGVKLDHDDLKDNLWSNMANQNGYDFINNDTNPSDDNGHGTHVAGTIGARGNNAIGATGVCWRVKIMAIKVLAANGVGSTEKIVQGVNYAVANGAHIINMSLGGGGYDTTFVTALNAAATAGVLVVVAAGNDGLSNNSYPTYPCNYPNANLICVGAVDQNFNMASFSNFSTTHVDIGAPGTNILSTATNSWTTPTTLSMDPGAWVLTPGYAFDGSSYLQNPIDWDGLTKTYEPNSAELAYTAFDSTNAKGAVLEIKLQGEVDVNGDLFRIFDRAGAGDPTAAGGLNTTSFSGNTRGNVITEYIDLTACNNVATCTLGFKMESNATVEKSGFQIQSLIIDPRVISTQGHDTYNGTSMATPHVAGLAALVKAYNPAFNATDLKNAVLNTGTKVPALTSRFGKGSVINAPNALKYIDPPTSVTFTIAP